MTTILIYVWLLFATPQDRMVCSMWLSQPPTQADMAAAGCIFTPEQAAGWTLRAVALSTGAVVCESPGTTLPGLPCDLHPLDQYLLRVYEPGYSELLCTMQVTHPGEPTPAEISSSCQAGTLDRATRLQHAATGEYIPPAPPAPICPMPELTASDLVPLATSNDLQILNVNLYWWYGFTGMHYAWQNRFDDYIYQAGVTEKVPPYIMKQMFQQESQFWPLLPQSIDEDLGEVGLGQLTDAGADLVIRYTPELYAEFCPQAAPPDSCALGYDLLSKPQRLMVRNIFRRSLMVYGTAEDAALQAARQMPTWAKIMKSYYCAAGEIVDGWGTRASSERWQMTLAAYHAGLECLSGGTVCDAGIEYLNKIRHR